MRQAPSFCSVSCEKFEKNNAQRGDPNCLERNVIIGGIITIVVKIHEARRVYACVALCTETELE